MRWDVAVLAMSSTLLLAPAGPPRGGPAARQARAAGLVYLEMVIGKAAPDEKLPMVVVLHGRGSRPEPPKGSWYGIDRPVRLIMPVAPDRLGEGYTWLPVSVTEGRTPVLARALLDRADQLAELILQVQARYPTSGQPIVTGFSQGAMLSATLATRHPRLIGEAFAQAGWLPPAAMPAEALAPDQWAPRLRAMHGRADPIVPLLPTRRAVEALQRLGWPAELHEYEGVGHQMSDGMHRQYGRWLREAIERAAKDPPDAHDYVGPGA